MIRILNAYYPTRTVVLFLCEAVLVAGVFLLATRFLVGPDTYIALVYQYGILKITCVCLFTVMLSYYFDLYAPQRISGSVELHFRLLLVVSTLSFCLAILLYLFPAMDVGPSVFFAGTALLTVVLLAWRAAYGVIITLPVLRERVYVLGDGQRAQSVTALLHSRTDAGMAIVEGTGTILAADQARKFAEDLRGFNVEKPPIDRIVVAMEDRRGTMPVQELLNLRLRGVVIEEAGSLIERLSGKLTLDGLNPSSLIFTEGFNVGTALVLARRAVSILVSSTALALCLPLIPLLVLAVRLSSPGPIFFSQVRVGYKGRPFTIYKFRTMRQDAEANGAQWATKNDSRITPLGRFMRKTRLDEIPQLWNVLRGDMGFVGPRPERPEFVQWLVNEIPYYNLRHMIRPGITGWAQVRYQYGATLEETKRKLEYDLYYIKHISLGLDLLIMFETIKTIVLRRGAQ